MDGTDGKITDGKETTVIDGQIFRIGRRPPGLVKLDMGNIVQFR